MNYQACVGQALTSPELSILLGTAYICIGLTILPVLHTGNVVQLSKSFKDGSKFLLLNKVNEALEDDPDLHGVPQQYRLQAL